MCAIIGMIGSYNYNMALQTANHRLGKCIAEWLPLFCLVLALLYSSAWCMWSDSYLGLSVCTDAEVLTEKRSISL